MAEEQTCLQCNSPMPAGAPFGLCPACLLKSGLRSQVGLKTQSETAAEPLTPRELAPHFPGLEIMEMLGHGGMGVVYKACQKKLERLVALKILSPRIARDPAFAERFAREARAMAKLNHPHIVTVHDFGCMDNGLFYFLMEFVDGVNLRHLLENRALPPAAALAIVPQICDALQYAHTAGIIHRDIKPENILLDKNGRVKIADFGLAKLVGQGPANFTLTESGGMLGTPFYMAPEQTEHPKDVDHRADIYSLGVVFYQMLTGELPLGRFAPPSQKVQIDVRLDEVVLHALEKDPERRYQQAGEVKTDVETIRTTPPRGPGSRVEKGRGFFWPAMALFSVLAASAIIVAVLILGHVTGKNKSGPNSSSGGSGGIHTAPPPPPSAKPRITSVEISGSPGNYTVTVNGSGFGGAPVPAGYFGDTSYFRIADAAQLGFGEWGYSGDENQLNYESWTSGRIVVGGLGAQPGDALSLVLWNPATGLGAAWGGNAPPVSSLTPQITGVKFSGSGQNTTITVTGNGFGNSPFSSPFTGDLNDFWFTDFRAHSSNGSSLFEAGGRLWGVRSPDSVTLKFQSWSDNKIVILGFGGTYGRNGATLEPGDPVIISLWRGGASGYTGPQTAWGGFMAGIAATTGLPPGISNMRFVGSVGSSFLDTKNSGTSAQPYLFTGTWNGSGYYVFIRSTGGGLESGSAFTSLKELRWWYSVLRAGNIVPHVGHIGPVSNWVGSSITPAIISMARRVGPELNLIAPRPPPKHQPPAPPGGGGSNGGIPTWNGTGGKIRINSGTGSFAGVSDANDSIAVAPGAPLSGQVNLTCYNIEPGGDVAPLISTPSWGDPRTVYKTLNYLPMATGTTSQRANVSLTAPTTPGTYHIIFAFAWDMNGGQVASGTDWASGPDKWGDGNDIATLNQRHIQQGQRLGYIKDKWLFGSPLHYTGRYIPLDAITVVVGRGGSAGGGHVRPTLVNPSAVAQATGLRLTPGARIYLYGGESSGYYGITPFARGRGITVKDAAGDRAATVVSTNSHTNGFRALGFENCDIVGVGVADFTSMRALFGKHVFSGPGYVSLGNYHAAVSFTITHPTLVVAVGLGTSQQGITFQGPTGLITDATTNATNDVGIGRASAAGIAHVYLKPGSYTIQETTRVISADMTVNHMVDLLGIYLFTGGANLLDNPGFERGLADWHVSAGTAVYTADNTAPHSGHYDAKGVEVNSGSLGRLYQDFSGKLIPGRQYTISGWIRTRNVTGPPGGGVVIALDYVAGGGWTPADGYVKEIGHILGTTGWTFYQSKPFILPTMPADASSLWFLTDFNAATGTAWFDDLSLNGPRASGGPIPAGHRPGERHYRRNAVRRPQGRRGFVRRHKK